MLLVHLFVYFARVNFCPFSLPLSWCQGLAAASDCDTPWMFFKKLDNVFVKHYTPNQTVYLPMEDNSGTVKFYRICPKVNQVIKP